MSSPEPPEGALEPSHQETDPSEGELEPAALEVEELPPQLEEQLDRIVRVAIKRHRGPLPSAESLRDYENTLEGLADRIVTMAEEEQAHRHQIEKDELHLPFKLARRGQTLGLVALVLMLAFGVLLVVNGHPVEGALLAGANLVGLVTVFVRGQREDERDTQQKPELEAGPEEA